MRVRLENAAGGTSNHIDTSAEQNLAPPVEPTSTGISGGSIMKQILIALALALAAALVTSACTDGSPLSADPVRDQQNERDRQNGCQGSERERPCPDDLPPNFSLAGK
jgi:hypothetical protein